MICGYSADDLVRSVAAARAGKFGRALSRIEETAVRFDASRSFADAADPFAAINQARIDEYSMDLHLGHLLPRTNADID
ncbi:hypothetical protein [Bradyrhizobium sp. USDA 3364]